MFQLQVQHKNARPITVKTVKFSIGSDKNNHLTLKHSSVAPLHAYLRQENGGLYLNDNHSPEGSYINDIRVTEKELKIGDMVRLGKVSIQVLAPCDKTQTANQWTLIADSSWLSGQAFTLTKNKSVIGRHGDCDITIPGTHLSRQHAELRIKDNQLEIRDLNSSNGTFINEQRTDKGIAKSGDHLRFDVYSFYLQGPIDDDGKTRARSNMTSPTPNSGNASNEAEKRWKTKPTAIGNRPEPPAPKGSKILNIAALTMGILVLGFLTYLALAS